MRFHSAPEISLLRAVVWSALRVAEPLSHACERNGRTCVETIFASRFMSIDSERKRRRRRPGRGSGMIESDKNNINYNTPIYYPVEEERKNQLKGEKVALCRRLANGLGAPSIRSSARLARAPPGPYLASPFIRLGRETKFR